MSDATVIPVHFQGLEEGVDPKALPPGTLLRAENVMMDKSRRLLKRLGTDALSKSVFGGGLLGEGLRLQTRGKDILMPSGQYECAYSTDLGKFQLIGRPSTLRMTKRGLVDSTRSAVSTDIALWGTNMLVSVTLSGYSVYPGFPGKGSILHLAIENVDTGQKVLPPLFIQEYVAWARVSVTGNTAFITCSTCNGQLFRHRVDLTTFAVTSSVIDNSTPSCTPCDSGLAIHPSEGVPYCYVVWVPSGADKLRVAKFRLSDFGNYSDITLLAASAWTPLSVSIAPTTNGVFVMAGTSVSSNYNLYKLDASTLATSVGPVNVSQSVKFVSVQDYDTNNLLVMTTGADTANTTPHKLNTYLCPKTTLVKTAATERITWHILAMTKAWKLNSRWYTLATIAPKSLGLTANDAIPNASSVVLEVETVDTSLTSVTLSPNPHMGTAESMTGWFPTRIGYVPQAIVRTVNGETTAHVPAAYRNREPLNFQSIPIGWSLYTVESNTKDTHRVAIVGAGGLAAAAAPYWLDGASARPYGFAVAPMILNLSPDASGSMVAGDYTYVVVFEWRDANGVLFRSPPSPPKKVTVAASGRVQITVTTASVSQHQGPPYTAGSGDPNAACGNPVTIAVYRSAVGGGNFFRLTLEPEFQVLVNDPTSGSVSVYDTKADADIGSGSPARPLTTQPQLYTGPNGTGGELEDVAPPSLLTVVTHGGRLVGLGPDKRTVWFSKDSTEDPMVAPGFNEVLTLGFATDKVAIASLNSSVVVFGEDGIDMVDGPGPDATGSGSWSIQRVQTDVGCINPRSIATTPIGIVFQSSRGIELFARTVDLLSIGKSVEETLRTYPTITSAVLVADKHEVRFTCNNGSNGIVLAYDYVNKCWFTRKYADTNDSGLQSVQIADAAVINGVYYLATFNGQIYAESTAHKLDSGSAYVTTDLIVTGLSFAGNLGRQRVKDMTVMGTSRTKHSLEISQRRDYATAWEAPVKAFDENSSVTQPGPLEKCRRTFPNQKCQAMEVRIRDLAPSPINYSTGEGVILESLAFRVTTKSGTAKTSADQQG